ncbi:hypothetical protein MKEN_00761600 [Mycena kentingensis (nom. inval.)]|nr:hypothetical protein MKEN_00761600 [Mycena kentingensis (nom. inval.)]
MSAGRPSWASPLAQDWPRYFYKELSPLHSHADVVIVNPAYKNIPYLRTTTPQKERVMMRKEHRPIWEWVSHHVKLRSGGTPSWAIQGGLVLVGQPGIGKSLTLYYLLAEAIHSNTYVVWRSSNDWSVVFDPDHLEPYIVKREDESQWQVPDCALLLCDSRPNFLHPPDHFLARECRAYIVHATSPDYSSFGSWAKHKNAWLWRMDSWLRSEFANLCFLRNSALYSEMPEPAAIMGQPPREYYTAMELFELLGPSPRHAIPYSKVKKENVSEPGDDLDLGDPRQLFNSTFNWMKAFNGQLNNKEQRAAFYRWFDVVGLRYGEPGCLKPTSSVYTPGFSYAVATPYKRKRLVELLPQASLASQLEAASEMFSATPQVTGALLEALMPRILSADTTSTHSAFLNPALDCTIPFNIPVAVSNSLFDPASDELPAVSVLHLIPPTGFASLDAFYLVDTEQGCGYEVVLLQATIARAHSISPKGIRALQEYLRRCDPEARFKFTFRFVFVCPSEDIGRAVCRKFCSWEGTSGARIRVSDDDWIPVGYAVLSTPDSFDASLDAFAERQGMAGRNLMGDDLEDEFAALMDVEAPRGSTIVDASPDPLLATVSSAQALTNPLPDSLSSKRAAGASSGGDRKRCRSEPAPGTG